MALFLPAAGPGDSRLGKDVQPADKVLAPAPSSELAAALRPDPAVQRLAPVVPWMDDLLVGKTPGEKGTRTSMRGSAVITIDVHASSAPNGFGSPSWAGYLANAMNALENDLSVIGDRSTDPTAYERAPAEVPGGEIAVTSFKSWRGVVDPPAPFDNDLGNRIHFGLHAFGDGQLSSQFTLEDLTFEIHSSDGDALVFVGNFIGFSYNGSTRFGVDWGTDRMKGGGDDTVYTSGNGTTLVDEIVYVGVGNAYWPGGGDPDPSNPVGGKQGAMDDYFAYVAANDPITVTGSYSILGNSGSDSVDIVAPTLRLEVPEGCLSDSEITVELWMRNLSPAQPVTGFQAFVEYDTGVLNFDSASSYTSVPFPLHINTMAGQTNDGVLELDGSVGFGESGTTSDALLATLVFQVKTDQCGPTDVAFQVGGAFPSELSFEGTPVGTSLANATGLTLDSTDPVISGLTVVGGDVDVDCEFLVTFSATVTDNCCVDADDVVVGVTLPTGNATLDTPTINKVQVSVTEVSISGSVLVSNLTSCPATVQVTVDAVDCCGNNATQAVETGNVNDVTNPVITCPADAIVECDEVSTLVIVDPFDGIDVDWVTDRYEPAAFESVLFDSDNRLHIGIDVSGAAHNRAPCCGSLFYATQGRSRAIAGGTALWTVSAEVYVSSDMISGNNLRRTDLWTRTGLIGDETGANYPIIGIRRFDPDDAFNPSASNISSVWRVWDAESANGWVELAHPVPGSPGWHALSITANGSSYSYEIDGTSVYLDTTANGLPLTTVYLQAYNFGLSVSEPGQDYDVYWDNLNVELLAGTGSATSTDNCDPAPAIAFADADNQNPDPAECGHYNYTITRTWTATDDCGNQDSCDQTITVQDTTPPDITCPSNVTIECDESTDPSNTGVASATDNCDADPEITSTDVSTQGIDPANCDYYNYTITRTWKAEDACGNFSTCDQVITVQDTTAPTFLTVPSDLMSNADAGVCTKTYTLGEIGSPTAGDNCDLSVAITFVRSDGEMLLDAPFAAANSPITITWTATDACGNSTQHVQTVTVNALNTVEVTVVLDSVFHQGASPGETPLSFTRNILFTAKNGTLCASPVCVPVTFTGSVLDEATATVSFDVDCGDWTSICAKDPQHTLISVVALGISGLIYTGASPLVLLSGDTDNDSDVDINDVTYFLFRFGTASVIGPGPCPYTGVRDSDFSINGAVGSEDYTFLTANWLSFSSCPCSVLMASDSNRRRGEWGDVHAGEPVVADGFNVQQATSARTRLSVSELQPTIAAAVDINGDGAVDYRDVRIFEQRNGLPNTLSSKIEHSDRD